MNELTKEKRGGKMYLGFLDEKAYDRVDKYIVQSTGADWTE